MTEGQLPPVQLAPGARSTLFIPVTALAGFGDGQVNATISGLSLPGETFAPLQKQWKIGVRPAFPAQTVNSGAVLQPGESWQAPAAQSQGFAPQTLQGQLLLSGKPPLNLARYIRELKAYPYGCLEQTASGLFPSLYTSAAQLKRWASAAIAMRNAARRSMLVSRACCRCSWKMAALRYGIKPARKNTG